MCDYILQIVRATREHPALLLGSSPRGSLALMRLSGMVAFAPFFSSTAAIAGFEEF